MARGIEACSTLATDLAVALLQVRPFDLLIADPREAGTLELLMRSQELSRRPQIILRVDDASVPPLIAPDQRGVLRVIEKPLLWIRLVTSSTASATSNAIPLPD